MIQVYFSCRLVVAPLKYGFQTRDGWNEDISLDPLHIFLENGGWKSLPEELNNKWMSVAGGETCDRRCVHVEKAEE